MTMTASAFAPASCGNLGVGFDVLGLALDGLGDTARVTIEPADETTARITEITGAEPGVLPTDERNSACVAAIETMRAAGRTGRVEINLYKGLPVGSGLGSSAASAVAGAYAVNLALGCPLRKADLLEPCLTAEQHVSGRHADNVAASLLGGMILVRSHDPLDVVRVPLPQGLFVVIVQPELNIITRDARACLPEHIDLATHVRQSAALASFVTACYADDLDLIARCMQDEIAETPRLELIHGGADALAALRDAGALGASISGSGPALFALCRSRLGAEEAGAQAVEAFRSNDVSARHFVCPGTNAGVRDA